MIYKEMTYTFPQVLSLFKDHVWKTHPEITVTETFPNLLSVDKVKGEEIHSTLKNLGIEPSVDSIGSPIYFGVSGMGGTLYAYLNTANEDLIICEDDKWTIVDFSSFLYFNRNNPRYTLLCEGLMQWV